MLQYECGISGTTALGPANYAAKVLAARGTEESLDTLMKVWFETATDGPSATLCSDRAGEGVAIMGEEIVTRCSPLPVSFEELQASLDTDVTSLVGRHGKRSSGIVGSYCKPNLGCEPFGTEVGKEWLETLQHSFERGSIC